jgi:hypothetical protein
MDATVESILTTTPFRSPPKGGFHPDDIDLAPRNFGDNRTDFSRPDIKADYYLFMSLH